MDWREPENTPGHTGVQTCALVFKIIFHEACCLEGESLHFLSCLGFCKGLAAFKVCRVPLGFNPKP
jgi:hypothetical protein